MPNLTSLQLTAFVLGIVASVLAVASIFFAFKNADKIKSPALAVVLTIIFPLIAISGWLMLIFSFVPAFASNDLLNILVSIAIAVVVCAAITLVSCLLHKKHKAGLENASK